MGRQGYTLGRHDLHIEKNSNFGSKQRGPPGGGGGEAAPPTP